MTGPIRDTTGERMQDAFVESPTRTNKTAVEVVPANTALNPLYVQIVGSSGGEAEVNVSTNVSMTITDEDFVRGYGSGSITITLPNASTNTKRRTIKHVGTQDLTIVGVGGQTIDLNADIQLRGNKKNSVTLFSESGVWWIG